MENNNSEFNPNNLEGSTNTQGTFGAPVQEAQPTQNPFGAPVQEAQPTQNPFGAPVQEAQPTQNPFGAPVQEAQPTQNPFGAPVQEAQPTQNPFGAPVQEAQPTQNPFGAPVQEAQPTQNPFGAPVQEAQPTQNPFGAPVQEAQPTQNPFGAPVQEAQPTQNPFGAPVQNGFATPNELPSIKPAKGEKKGLFITIVIVGIIVVLGLLTAIGVFAYNAFNKPADKSSENSTSTSSGNGNSSKVEFSYFDGSDKPTLFKLKEIKRDVKIGRDVPNAVVYIFDVENTDNHGSSYFSFSGISSNGAFVRPAYTGDVEDTTILEDNKCKSADAKLEKGDKERLCLVYPIAVAKLLVPGNEGRFSLYRPVDIDSEAKESDKYIVENKKKGDALIEKNYDGKIESSTTFSELKEAKDKDGRDLFVMEATLTVKEDVKYLSRAYDNIQVKTEDGIHYRETYADYKIDGTLSNSELSKRLSEPSKKGDVIKYTISFPKTDKKITNVVTSGYDTVENKEITNIFAV